MVFNIILCSQCCRWFCWECGNN